MVNVENLTEDAIRSMTEEEAKAFVIQGVIDTRNRLAIIEKRLDRLDAEHGRGDDRLAYSVVDGAPNDRLHVGQRTIDGKPT